jgi:hypothetical protein
MWKAKAQTGLRLLCVSQFHDPTFEVLTSSEIHTLSTATPKNAQRTSDRFNAHSKRRKDDAKCEPIRPIQKQTNSPAVRHPSFNRHRRCIRSSFGAFSDGPRPSVKFVAKPITPKNSAHYFHASLQELVLYSLYPFVNRDGEECEI